MGSILRLGVLVLLMFVVSSARAEAGFWDWLEELNGPGPSTTRGNFMMNFSCRRIDEIARAPQILKTDSPPATPEETALAREMAQRAAQAEERRERFIPQSFLELTNVDSSTSPEIKVPRTVAGNTFTSSLKTKTITRTTRKVTYDFARNAANAENTVTAFPTDILGTRLRKFTIPKDSTYSSAKCMFFDVRLLHADDDTRFYPVDLVFSEVGTSVWIHNLVEVGAGVGALWFTSKDPVTERRFTSIRPTISFPRISFKPLLALPHVDDTRWGFLHVYFKESIIIGTLDEGDFASKPGNVFSRTSQRVESMGFIIDLVSLFGRQS